LRRAALGVEQGDQRALLGLRQATKVLQQLMLVGMQFGMGRCAGGFARQVALGQ
jgi:hypothetical protein